MASELGCAGVFVIWVFRCLLSATAWFFTSKVTSLMLVASNGMVGLFTNLGKTPVWVMAVLLFFSFSSLVIFCIKIYRILKATYLECQPCLAQIRCLYYVIEPDGIRIPYIWWPKFVIEIFVHISYVVCAIAILVLVTKGNHKEKKIIGISFTIWVLVNTAFAVVLSLIETHINNFRIFLGINRQLEEIEENLSIPPVGNEKIMQLVDPPLAKNLNIDEAAV